MNRNDFTEALELELQWRGQPFTPDQVEEFIDGVLPLVREDPDATLWAGVFINAAGHGLLAAG
jgi:hypothetical protein